MSLIDKLQSDMKQAMKSGEKELLSTLRMVVSSVKYEAIDDKDAISDEKVIEILRREAKKRRESIEAYMKAGREEQEAQERKELEVIESYLPKLMDENQVREQIKEIIGSEKVDNFGQAMGKVMAKLKGKAEGNMVSRVLKEEIEK